MKIYKNKNVYDAAIERLNFIFDEFDKICVSFSGGKDNRVPCQGDGRRPRSWRSSQVYCLSLSRRTLP